MGEPIFHQGSLQVSGAALMRLLWNLPNAVIGVNVIGAIKTGGSTIDQAKANALGAAIKSAFSGGSLLSHVSTQAALANVGLRDINSPNLVEYLDSGASVQGTGAGDPLPGGNAVCVSLRTNLAGPKYRGRVYLGGFTEADNTAGSAINATLGTSCAAFITAIQGAMTGQGLTMAVISRPHLAWDATYVIHHNDGTEETQNYHHAGRPGQANQVTSIALRNATWDSQRRRTAAGGGSTLMMPLVVHDLSDGVVSGRWATQPSRSH